MTAAVKRVRRRLATVACVSVLLLAAGCTFNSASRGDPGQRRLRKLAAEPVLTVSPPGLAQPAASVGTPAHKQPAGFGSGGWEGPSVIASFTTSAQPADVLRFYDDKATASGWRGTATAPAYGVTNRWTKTYPDGTPAYLIVTFLPRGDRWSYQVAASAPAAV